MIGNFYKLHRSKGILYTYTNFKKSGFSKSQIYAIMQTFDPGYIKGPEKEGW